MNRKILSLFLFFFVPAFFATTGAQTLLNPGDPDPTFGTNGRVVTEFAGGCLPGDLILLPDGKILTVCSNSVSAAGVTRQNLLLVRYNSDGSLDNDFGVGGVKTIFVAESASPFEPKKMYLQPGGKIVIAGHFNDDFALLRVNPDGSIDASFGENGLVVTDFSGFEERRYDRLDGLTVRPDGKLLLFGTSTVQNLTFSCPPSNQFCSPPEFERLALAQYDANGSPDLAFGERGVQRSRFTDDRNYARGLVNEPDGKFTFIVGVNERVLQTNGWVLLFTQLAVRYNADGSIDKDYGKTGFTTLPNAAFYPLSDGKFLTEERCNSLQGCGYNTRFMRFNSDFTRDMTFGSNGSAQYSLYFFRDNNTIYPQPDGKFLVSTHWMIGGFGSYQAYSYIYRFNSDGSMDLSFGNNNGVIGFDLDGDDVLGSGSPPKYIFQPDGKIIAANYFLPPQNTRGKRGLALMRFIGANSKF